MTSRGSITLVGGGTRSGKSAFALELARKRGLRRVFIATAQPFDDEMRARITAHAAERGADFETFEEPLELTRAVRAAASADVVLIDCVTLWLSNLLLAEFAQAAIADRVAELVRVLEERALHAVIVTNEVGMGIVPDSALGRLFRDIAGRTNQQLAAVADEVYFAMLGVVLRIRPEPIAGLSAGSVK